jgi:hypothetical protein
MALVSNKSPLNKKKTHFPQTNIEKKHVLNIILTKSNWSRGISPHPKILQIVG